MYLHMGASQNTRYGSIPHRAIHSPRSIPPIIHDTPWFITMLVPCGALWSWLILWFAAGLEDLEGKDSINFMRSWKITLLLPLWHGASGTICCASQVFIAAKYYMCVYADVTWCGVVWYIMNICIHYIRDYIQKFVDSPSYYILPIYYYSKLCSLKWSYESGGGRFEGRSETMKVSKKACQCSVWADATVHFLQEAFVSGIQCHLDPWGIWY